jgi:metal-dependent amidase/aminoacylase/carboxypeptidase family protein
MLLGIHVMSNMKTGNIYYRSGNTQTGRSYFKLVVQGKGGHGSSPHLANDAIVAASSFVMNLQTIVSRRIYPFDTASITIGNFEDFAYYLEKVPGCFFYVGAEPHTGEAYPHHHPKFNINEKSLIISAKAMAAVVSSFCGGSES